MQGTTVRSCRARAERGNLLLCIVTLLTSGTERAIVGVLPSSLLAASCHHDFRHVCGFYTRPHTHDCKISYEAVVSVALMADTPLTTGEASDAVRSTIGIRCSDVQNQYIHTVPIGSREALDNTDTEYRTCSNYPNILIAQMAYLVIFSLLIY